MVTFSKHIETGNFSMNIPPRGKWIILMSGTKDFQIHVQNAPNWLHRKMQRLILGIHWVKND